MTFVDNGAKSISKVAEVVGLLEDAASQVQWDADAVAKPRDRISLNGFIIKF